MKDRIAIVTGAASGLGLGIAQGLARRGARVVIADLDGAGADRAAQSLRAGGAEALALAVDVTQESAVEQLLDRVGDAWGVPAILVNNAGIVHMGASTDVALSDWQAVIGVNLTAVFLCARATARRMIPAGGGAIVNIASTAAYGAAPGFAAYSASKGAVLSLTRALAVEWAPHNIRVNSVSPGMIDTPLARQARARDPEGFARRDKRVPIRRQGSPDDIADAVCWFAGDQTGYVTGQDVKVDGGLFAQHPGYVP